MAIALIGSFALWTWRRSDPGPARVTLAVLPFKNIGSVPEREYLADGLAEETTAALAQVEPEHFVVTARTSTLNYRNTTKTVAQIGAELSVDYLVEGSIQEEGGRVRVRSSLTRVADQAQIWSNAYDSEPRSMLELQQALSSTIAAQIRLTLSPERLNALARRQTQDPVAYDLYLPGRTYWRHFQPETTKLAVEHFARATARDPGAATIHERQIRER